MPHRAQGIKKSNFVAGAPGSAATFDYVESGTNKKITLANLVASLGVTGTIVQDGASSGTPILDTQGSVNNIRNVEDGPGFQSSVSAENGITMEHNFQQDAIGTPLFDDLTALSPTMKSLTAGTGLQFNVVDDNIEMIATGVVQTTKTVVVNEITDFPTAVAGVITLVAGLTYLLANDVSTSNRFVFSNDTSLASHSLRGPTLTYTGSGTMFTGVDVDVKIREIRLDCPNGKLFDFSDTVGGVQRVSVASVFVDSCVDTGDFDDLLVTAIDGLFILSVTQGLVFTGSNFTNIELGDISLFSSSVTFVGINLGTAVSNSASISACLFSAPSGGIGISGAASSANLNGVGSIIDNRFVGGMTAELSGLDHDDIRWQFLGNQGIEDTRPDSLSYNTAGVAVVIASAGVGVKIAGTWVDDNSSHFTVDGSGKVTYTGVSGTHAPISATVTADPASGSNKDFAVCIAINGSVVVASTVPARASAADRVPVTVIWQHNFAVGDFVEVFLQNDTDTVDFDVIHAVLRIN